MKRKQLAVGRGRSPLPVTPIYRKVRKGLDAKSRKGFGLVERGVLDRIYRIVVWQGRVPSHL